MKVPEYFIYSVEHKFQFSSVLRALGRMTPVGLRRAGVPGSEAPTEGDSLTGAASVRAGVRGGQGLDEGTSRGPLQFTVLTAYGLGTDSYPSTLRYCD